MTKTDIGIYRGLKEKFDPEVHIGFYITTDTGEFLLGDQSLGQTIADWKIEDGVLTLTLNTGEEIEVTFPEASETLKGLLSAADKAQLNSLVDDLESKVAKETGKSLVSNSEIEKLANLPNSTELTNSIATAKAAGDNAQSDLNAHKQNTSNPHSVTKEQVELGNVTNDAQVKRTEMGVANGVATLDSTGKVPAAQLPSFVDDIIDVYATYSKSDTGVLSAINLFLDAAKTQPVTGEAGKIYLNVADGEPGYQFRWTGTVFAQTGASSIILGEVAGTAYDGAKGKANADNIAKIKGTSLSHIKDTDTVTTAVDKVSINYECFAGDQYGATGTAHAVELPAATTEKAGVMSAADKTKLEGIATDITNAVNALDATVTSTDGTNVQVKVTETDGKITAVNITKDDTAKKADLTAEVTRATTAEGNIQTALDNHKADQDKKHIPAGGHERQILAWESDGTAKWDNLSNMFTGLEELLAYGVEWDVTVADPHLTRIGNMSLHKTLPIQSQLKGCIAQEDKVIYWLDEDNWAYKKGGNPDKGEEEQLARLDGYDGTVRIYCPNFYIKSKIIGNKRQVWLSTVKIDNTWTYQPEILLDAYRSTVLNAVPEDMGYLSTLPVNSAISVVNTAAYCRGGNNNSAYDKYLETDPFRTQLGKPRTYISRASMRTYSRNAGSEMLSYDEYKNIFYWLYVVEYANFNCQEAYNEELTAEGYRQGGMGPGVTAWNSTHWSNYNGYYPLTPCGYTNEFGNGTGVKSFTTVAGTNNLDAGTTEIPAVTSVVPRWRGFENPFGDIWTNLDGIIIDADANNHPNNMNYVYTCLDASKYADSLNDGYEKVGEEVHTDGYTKLFDLGDAAHIIPNVMGGGTTTYKCDYHWTGDKNATLRTLIVGGNAHHGARAGLGGFHSGSGVSSSSASVGFRSVSSFLSFLDN